MRRTAAAVFLLFLVGCAGRVAVDYREGADFSTYETYALAEQQEAAGLDQERVQDILVNQLEQEGLRQASPMAADLQVRYRFVELVDRDSSRVFWGLGGGTGGAGLGLGMSTPIGQKERTSLKLVLQMVDQAQQRVVWEAQSRRSLDASAAPAKRREWIRETIGDMLEHFPPDQKSGASQ